MLDAHDGMAETLQKGVGAASVPNLHTAYS